MVLTLTIVVAALWLAYGNGANDNFKGVATLYGSDTTTFKGALWWATATTFAGSVVSVAIARNLVTTFSGKGLVPDSLAASPAFAMAVGLGAAFTIFAATYIGMPTSTTHALIGALLGTGLAASASINGGVLLTQFAVPMLSSPLLAIALSALLYSILRAGRKRAGIQKETCLRITDKAEQPVAVGASLAGRNQAQAIASYAPTPMPDMGADIDEKRLGKKRYKERYKGRIIGIEAQKTLDVMHYLSAGAVCFSRAVNDTPKVAALLLMTSILSPALSVGLIGLIMSVGGLIQSRQVAETMSKRITTLSPGQGFTANITTAGLVLFASNLGVPVSTTHVSCGSIFGIGAVNRTGRWTTIARILLTWVTTLPAAAIISGLLYYSLLSIR